jgi:hypothetical protein
LRLARHGVLDALDFLRGLDLGLLPCLRGCGGLCVGVSCFLQKIYSSLRSFSKRLHHRTSKKAIRPCRIVH